MVERIIQHKHCSICRNAIPSDEDVCSQNCKERLDAIQKKKRNYLYFIYAMMFVLIFLLFFGNS